MTSQPHPQRCCHYDVCYVVQTSGKCAYERFGDCASYSTNPHTPAAPATEMRGFVMIDRQWDFVLWLKEHDAATSKAEREQVLDEMVKLTMMIETNESETWERVGRPKNDGYINGSHSGYGHALRDIRQWIDQIKQAESLRGGATQQGGERR